MGKVQRRVVADGAVYEVACAVRADAVTSPVSTFLDELAGGLVDASSAPDLAPDEQIGHQAWLEAAFERFAEYGDLPGPHAWNRLRDGVWEIKRFNLRITFFDTDGQGSWDPKLGFEGERLWGPPDLPEFDDYIRLATAFVKPPHIRKTPPGEIELAKRVRDEDVSHDRAE
ncbi:conserved hypothetical protein [Beutenbergia cavernae DSM 12333]|uniref:Uncharacterized protein n=1 Tax=Beutenbergia cavernae (strain ATCC BAA-8 / DSM 12333 / CCUG 43141 / JCM 11478 / NBRC 16432 / NCIMB 13614 / HKI 0122) TaxID=471853 RepID=C5C4M9_BEUC1|nr:hypothetical protein [Beutenbergia cavernae]ACQ82153.1 conserved hypothetical protein [Beutenbergia cavernae DSM 12333]